MVAAWVWLRPHGGNRVPLQNPPPAPLTRIGMPRRDIKRSYSTYYRRPVPHTVVKTSVETVAWGNSARVHEFVVSGHVPSSARCTVVCLSGSITHHPRGRAPVVKPNLKGATIMTGLLSSGKSAEGRHHSTYDIHPLAEARQPDHRRREEP